jgi:hypothetical protein
MFQNTRYSFVLPGCYCSYFFSHFGEFTELYAQTSKQMIKIAHFSLYTLGSIASMAYPAIWGIYLFLAPMQTNTVISRINVQLKSEVYIHFGGWSH